MPFELHDEVQALQDIDTYSIENEHDLASEDPAQLLEGAVERVAENSESIAEPDVLDVYRSLLKQSDAVPAHVMSKLLDSLMSGFQSELDATTRDEHESPDVYASHKTPLEIYAFLLRWFVSAAEKVKESDGDAPGSPVKARKPRGGKAPAKSRAAGKNKASAAEWSLLGQIPAILALICKVLKLPTQRMWTTSAEREAFLMCITRPAYHVMENEQYMKSQDIRKHTYKVICLAVKHHNHAFQAQIAIVQALQFHEHLAEPMAECLSVLADEFDHLQLSDDILREIAGMKFNGQDNKGPRTFSKFLTKLSDLTPRAMLKNMSLLQAQLDSDAYPIRVAIVEVVGALIVDISRSEDLEDKDEDGEEGTQQKRMDNLHETLLERALDLSSYVRSKVLAVLVKLCDIPKQPRQRMARAQVAVAALEDKIATVRKNAAALLIKLVTTHPYAAPYGGHLNMDIWQTEYNRLRDEIAEIQAKHTGGKEAEVVQERPPDENEDEEGGGDTDHEEEKDEDAMDEDDPEGGESDDESRKRKRKGKKAPKLKPRKSQIVELQGEEAEKQKKEDLYLMELQLRRRIMDQLLGSKSKAEVLESMEFFRIMKEYEFGWAESGIKKMLHLIWNKDNSNSTSEDGQELKGIRQRLLECYRFLYFDPLPDLEPKAQVQRIAKNMILLTEDATLAELTSLEEMMRIMMEDDQIHADVIAKLWNVYSTPRNIPPEQRRGAIMILGMLAVARRSVVADHVGVMLKIGLGRLGRDDLKLARYTCVALQRLNGSAKKIKGSLQDKTIRFEMTNPVFKHLQDALEQPTRSKEWFGLAEQAINTVYALGDHLDALCSNLIRNLTRRAFTPMAVPEGGNAEGGDSAGLSQFKSRSQTLEEEEEAELKEKQEEKDPDAMDEDTEPQTHPGDVLQTSDAPPAAGDGTPPERKTNDMGDEFVLSQMFFVVGHVPLKHVVYLELVERGSGKRTRRKEAPEKAAEKAAGGKAKEREELDQVAGHAEDEIGDRIAHVGEHELLDPQSLLGVCGPILEKNRTLPATTTLALSKLLCFSSHFCDKIHQLLFEIPKNPSIRSNIDIALGDVAVSFSSIINELYKSLTDRNFFVKKNMLMVLTHLILKGMITVKDQFGEMAKRLEDDAPRIAELAKLFFKELPTKDNAIHNNLPDIISHLSAGEHAVDEEMFQRTLTYIFSFIEKEKQAESIVEKLCQRFQLSDDPRQWRDIAFCLSLLPFKSERSVKKLIEGLPFYRDKLHEAVVFERFTEILNKARQNKSPNKPDTELGEFEQILDEHRAQGEEDRDLEKRVQGKKAAAKRKAAKRKPRKKTPVEEDEEAAELYEE
ncbi:Condensin complex subunit 1 [Mycena chlorophos]|uniref:Condensin complex subunit 1 n=1 Tax=Mycena chlorophos TaxID=658473 RepID=A0A8H6TKB6_MYCCL|nr:Condensin complex subunit 1 [Mycena chlorophos]